MDPNTFPTKGNLILAKNSLALSRQGYELMDKKRNILIREMMNLVDQAKDIQGQIDETFRTAYEALQKANMEMGIAFVDQISHTVPVEDSIRIKTRSVMGTEIPLVEYTRDFEDITYTENGKTMLVNYLSAGYQSLLWMLMEISFRIALLNPEMSDYSQAEGIVLIDEIDMHLHPRWQWKILDALHSSFPKVQFIAATHSPIIISSFRDAKLLSIGQNGVEELSGAYAYSIDDVVAYKQGSSGIPQELWQRKKEFEDAFYQRNKQNSQKALDGMKELFGEDNTEVKRAEAKMRMRKNWN